MLKSIVNGAEHDIISIPMKGKNLFDVSTVEKGRIDNGEVGYTSQTSSLTIEGATVSFTTTATYRGVCSGFFEIPETGNLWFNFTTNKTLGVKFVFYDSSKTWLNADYIHTLTDPFPAMATIPTGARYVRISFTGQITGGSDYTMSNIMLNLGSAPLLYEPYGYQNGWEVRDNQNRIIWGREDELQTITGTLPFKGYDLPIKVKSLLGNATQNGTPSPDSPIIPEMCGVLNDNLAIIESDTRTVTNNYYYDSRISDLLEAGTYTISFVYDSKTAGLSASIGRGDQNSYQGDLKFFAPPANGVLYKTTVTLTSAGYVWARFLRSASQSTFSYSVSKIRIEEGSSAYGWKIPLTNAGQTTPIYLGEVPTIRRIKKLVLTGEENWEFFSNNNGTYGVWQFHVNDATNGLPLSSALSNIASYGVTATTRGNYQYGVYLVTSGTGVAFQVAGAKDIFTDTSAWKSYLATQYQNGTPVTVWYILSEPETGIVNEPLAKIGDYADELTTIKVNGLSAPLYAIGDYKDILNLSTGVLTRKIGKLVLTGTEDIRLETAETDRTVYFLFTKFFGNFGFCTHIEWKYPYQPTEYNRIVYVTDGRLFISLSNVYLNDQTVQAFKAYLANQYAAGTPVTIWYVLETPTTETVTVPTGMTGEIEGYLTQISTPTPTNQSIPKWNGKEETGGTYAVTVYTLPEIPTTTGKNTLTVDTTIAPYNVIVDGHIKYTYWGKIREDVRSGLAQTKFPVGTILYDNNDESTGRAFQVVGYDKHFDPSLTARGYNHSMTLCQLKLSGPWQFDATEAFLYTTVEMQPGTYKFKIPNYDTTYGGNKTYYFTSTASVPVDSQITLSWAYRQLPKTVTAYAGPNPQTKTTAIAGFNALQLSEWIEGESPEAIDLGTIKLANNDPDSAYGKLNHIHRARYGSNNYYQSGLRQLLNTDLASNNWWHPTTIFDRPYANRTTNGYLRSLNEDFINVLATPEITHIANNLFEYPSLDGRTFALNTEYKINTDKVFLLSHTEVGLSASPNIGTVLDYYSTHNTNNDRIKYRIDNGNAYYWWFRTPYPSNAYYFRLCFTSGALSYDSALSTLGVAPAHIIQ